MTVYAQNGHGWLIIYQKDTAVIIRLYRDLWSYMLHA